MYKEKTTGLWCRPDTLDEYVIKEQRTYNPLLELCKGKSVMDIGANIGAFTFQALAHGATRVVSFEPDKDNIGVFQKQGFDNRVKLVKRAVSDSTGTALFYVNSGKNKGTHSLQEIQRRESYEVKTVSFRDALDRCSPQILKIDIEGGEYDLNFKDLPLAIEAIAIELHLLHGDNRKMAPRLIKVLRKQFPEVLKDPVLTAKNWTTLFIGRR